MIRLLWSDAMIKHIADLMIRVNSKDSALLPKVSVQLTDIQKRFANLLKAVEAGIFNDTTQQRMTELEQQRQQLKIEIAKEKMKKTRVSREDVIEWLLRFRDLDMKKENHRCILNDSFLNTAYVYYDEIALMFNYREGTETISLAQVEGSDLLFFWGSDVNRKGHTKWYALFAVMTLHRICNRSALNQEIDRKGLPEYPAAKHVQGNEAQSPVHCPEKSQNWVS